MNASSSGDAGNQGSQTRTRRPNILVVLFDDLGFADLGCYGSEIATPNIDALAAQGLRYTGFHTTAMCSTTRAAMLTGRNHHSVGVGCLANFDSGLPGYRGKIRPEAGTLAEMLRPHGYRNYMAGKWHVTPLTETGPTGPFDGWPLGRGFDRFYGFMDAQTDHYAPELIQDNSFIDPPRTPEEGYHLTEDLVDQAIGYLKGHLLGCPDQPWFLYLSLGAVHAPHQVPRQWMEPYDASFADGWDNCRDRRLQRQIELGIVPPDTVLPDRNAGVRAWDDLTDDHRLAFTRLQAAYAGMVTHSDHHLGRLLDVVRETEQHTNTVSVVLSDNGASQEGGPAGMVNAMGPFNLQHESIADKVAAIDDIGGPRSLSNYPLGWAMASNTPLRRYKQNTHGGGVRDPFVVHWPGGIVDPGGLRHGFHHVTDLVPTLLDIIGVEPPEQVNGVEQMPVEGTSFAGTVTTAPTSATETGTRPAPQYFEMFGHRGLWAAGWKAVAYHEPGTPFDEDRWELFHLDTDFAEARDLALEQPERLQQLIDQWWVEAEAHQVLPLDDSFASRFAKNAARHHGNRSRYELWAGIGHIPTEVAPDIRSRSYRIHAEVEVPAGEPATGVLVAHGDSNSGYSLYFDDGHLVHHQNIGHNRQEISTPERIAAGRHTVSFVCNRAATPESELGTVALAVDDVEVVSAPMERSFWLMVSFSGLDVGRDPGTPVGPYRSPNPFSGDLRRVIFELDADQSLDHEAAAQLAAD